MTRDELSACVRDTLAIGALDAVRLAARLQARAKDNSENLLIATLETARDLAEEIAWLERELEDAELQHDILKEGLDAVKATLDQLISQT
jgi:hypothetical protein